MKNGIKFKRKARETNEFDVISNYSVISGTFLSDKRRK